MFNCHTENAIGARSKGYDRSDLDAACHVFDQMVLQIQAWSDYVVDVVMHDDGKEIRREYIGHA